MAKIDKNQEAIAIVRMAIDNYDRMTEDQQPKSDEVPEPSELAQFNTGLCLWALGSPECISTAKTLEQEVFVQHPDVLLRHLDTRLKAFLREHVSVDCISDDVALKVGTFSLTMIHYMIIMINPVGAAI